MSATNLHFIFDKKRGASRAQVCNAETGALFETTGTAESDLQAVMLARNFPEVEFKATVPAGKAVKLSPVFDGSSVVSYRTEPFDERVPLNLSEAETQRVEKARQALVSSR
jgi:hypothetical protein